jgi:anti-anti-sigma factor
MNVKLLPNDGEVLRIEIVGNVTRDAWPAGRDLLAEHCGEGIYAHLVILSLKQSLYVDSSGVDWLINCHRRFQKGGGRLVLHSLAPASQQLLKMMRLDRVLEIEPTEAGAAARARSGRPASATEGQNSNGSNGNPPASSNTTPYEHSSTHT